MIICGDQLTLFVSFHQFILIVMSKHTFDKRGEKMSIPFETQVLLQKALIEVQYDKYFCLNRNFCSNLLQSFGPSTILSQGSKIPKITKMPLVKPDFVIIYLAIITFKHVFTVIEDRQVYKRQNLGRLPYKIPEEVVNILELVLEKRIDFMDAQNKINAILDTYEEDLRVLENITTKNVFRIFEIGQLITHMVFSKIAIEPSFPTPGYGTFVFSAFEAWALQDNNNVGDWVKNLYGTYIENYTDITIDKQKASEFWIWWLTEAIPQAWKMGDDLQ